MAKTTQIQRLFDRLSTGQNLTVTEARRLGVKRLSARIHDLRNEGYTIYTNSVTRKGKKVTAYRLHF